MSRKETHKTWCDLMVARAKDNKRKSTDYPYKTMLLRGEK